MRMLIILVLLGGAGYGGWYVWAHHLGTAPSQATNAPAAEVDQAPTIGQGEPPAAAKALIAEADARWAAAGADPARSADAPHIALTYSRALRAIDGVAGQQPRADALVRDRLTPLGSALFFARANYPNDSTGTFAAYKAVANDSPDKIGRQFGMARELVNRLRGQAPDSGALQVGDSVTVLRIKDQTEDDRQGYLIRIDKSEFRLDLYIAGIFARRYHITHGAAVSPTPTGATTITAREWHPQWTKPGSNDVLPYGHPDNILGPIWLRFAAEGIGKSGIGIHGYTGADGEIGVMASNGCIRLLNEQAEELFRTIPAPNRATTTVVITE